MGGSCDRSSHVISSCGPAILTTLFATVCKPHTYAPRLGNFFAPFSPASESIDRRWRQRQSAAVDGALMMDRPAVRAPVRQRA